MRKDNQDVKSDYFENLNHNSAYFLGFLTGDGCILETVSNLNLVLRINSKDEFIIYSLAKELNCNNISHSEFKQKSGYVTNFTTFKVANERLCKSLIKYGVVPRKTGIETLPVLPNDVKFDYLRGIFDADGCIKTCGSVGFASKSKEYLNSLKKDICFDYGGIYNGHNCWSYEIASIEHVCIIAKKMYHKDNLFFLKRKKERFDALLKPVYYTAFNETKTLTEWFKDTRIRCKREQILERIKYSNLSFEECLTLPPTKAKDLQYQICSINEWKLKENY